MSYFKPPGPSQQIVHPKNPIFPGAAPASSHHASKIRPAPSGSHRFSPSCGVFALHADVTDPTGQQKNQQVGYLTKDRSALNTWICGERTRSPENTMFPIPKVIHPFREDNQFFEEEPANIVGGRAF